MTKSVLLLPWHGHAPYIFGGKLARSMLADICIPNYYKKVQHKILLSEFPDIADKIFTSEVLGDLFKPLLQYQDSSFDLSTYAKSVYRNIESISKNLEALYREGVDATSLTGVKRKFTRFDLSINAGLPVFSPILPVFYMFTGKMSAVYNLSPYQNKSVQSLSRIWKEVESKFSGMFVPRLNSLFQQEYDTSSMIFTPPFASPYPLDNTSLPKDTTLVIASGTGMDIDNLCALAKSASNPYTLNESPYTVTLPRVSSNAWGNPHVTAVLARGGLGSIWQAVVNRKPIGVLPAQARVDPEIYHNVNMVQNSGIGMILEGGVFQFMNNLSTYSQKIEEHLALEKAEFNTNDGFEYVSTQILAKIKKATAH